MISIFDDHGVRQSIAWNGVELNDDEAEAGDGFVTDVVAYNTPMNFSSEPRDDITVNGGGIEFYNPRVGTRVLTVRGRVHAATEGELNEYLRPMQESFSPLYLQSTATNRAGTLTWPPPSGLPSWVTAKPLTFTRVMPRDFAPTAFVDGKMLLQHYVVPLQLPDPIRSVTNTGIGAEWEASWLVMNGGRSFARADSSLVGTGSAAVTWNKAIMWPSYYLAMAGAGSATMTIATSGHTGSTLTLDLSTTGASTVVINTDTRSIWTNNVLTPSLYAGGDFPLIHPDGATVTYANTTNVTTATCYYRQSDWF